MVSSQTVQLPERSRNEASLLVGHILSMVAAKVRYKLDRLDWVIRGRKNPVKECARKGWVVSIGRRRSSGSFPEYYFFYVGHPTRQSATDAVRRSLNSQIDLRRVKAERELRSEEIAKEGLRFREVRFAAKGSTPP